MNVTEFRKKININSKVIVEGREYQIKQLIKFRLGDNEFYTKLFFQDGYVLADDLNENIFILVKEITTNFQLPFAKEILYRDKKFNFSYEAQAIAEEVWGDGVFQVGDSEKFWDYKTKNGDYLSLGIDSKTGKRMDFVGKIITASNVDIK